jgi:hypothetical protein
MWMPVLIELDGLTAGQFRANKLVRSLAAKKRVASSSPEGACDSQYVDVFYCVRHEDFVPALRRDAVLRT